jgi:predicted nuclease with TOPRIM domain
MASKDELRIAIARMTAPERLDFAQSPERKILEGLYELTAKLHERTDHLDSASVKQTRLAEELKENRNALETMRASARRLRISVWILASLLSAETAVLGWILLD